MPTLIEVTERKHLSELVGNINSFGDSNFADIHRATVQLGGTATDVEPIGTPIVWVDGTSQFEIYTANAQITAAKTAGTSPLAGGAVIAVLIGEKYSAGFNKADLDLTTNPYATALFNGEYILKDAGMEWGGIAAAEQTAFKNELATKGISFIAAAAASSSSYINA